MKPSRSSRHRLAIVPVALAHAAAIALAIANHAGAGPVRGVGKPSSIVVVDIPPPQPTARRAARIPPPAVPIVDVPLLRPAALEQAAAMSEPMPILSEASLAPGEVCDVAGRVLASLRGDPKVVGALAMLPKDARSVANAVMLWDGRWIEGQSTATRFAMGEIRAAVLAEVAAAPAPCRAEIQTGPALMMLPGTPDTVLALGSGRWRWADMFGASDAPAMTTAASANRGGAAASPPAT